MRASSVDRVVARSVAVSFHQAISLLFTVRCLVVPALPLRRYAELRRYCATIPCFVVANKIDVDYSVTSKSFAFATKNDLPLRYVSAADGTNVVSTFHEAIKAAWAYKHGEKDFVAEVLELLGEGPLAGAGVSGAATSGAGAVPRPLGPAGTEAAGGAGAAASRPSAARA